MKKQLTVKLVLQVLVGIATFIFVFLIGNDYAPLQNQPSLARSDCQNSPISLSDSLVSTAHAALFEPLRNPDTNSPDPFEFGVVTHGCNPPVIDLTCSPTEFGAYTDGPCSIPNNSTVWLRWTSVSDHGGTSCIATRVPLSGRWTGFRLPNGNEESETLSGPRTYRYRLDCKDGSGASFDIVDIDVGGGGGAPMVNLQCDLTEGPCNIPNNSSSTLTWTTLGNPTSCMASGNWSGNKSPAGGSESTGPLAGPAVYFYSISCTDGNAVAADSVIIVVGGGGGFIQGDIYSSGVISGLTVTGPAVVSSGAGRPTITSLGSGVYLVSGYSPSLTDTWETILLGNITRLLRERARPLGTNNIDSGTFNINPNNRLGGEVWRVSGGLTLNNVNFTGPTGAARGTIIVESGNITINNNVQADTPVAIGLVAQNGSITIGPGVTRIRNIYFYAPYGTITFEDSTSSLWATGAFISQSFIFNPRVMMLIYDSNIALNPPPGFISFLLPTILETSP